MYHTDNRITGLQRSPHWFQINVSSVGAVSIDFQQEIIFFFRIQFKSFIIKIRRKIVLIRALHKNPLSIQTELMLRMRLYQNIKHRLEEICKVFPRKVPACTRILGLVTQDIYCTVSYVVQELRYNTIISWAALKKAFVCKPSQCLMNILSHTGLRTFLANHFKRS